MEKHHLHHQKKQNIIQIGNTENLPYFGHKKKTKNKTLIFIFSSSVLLLCLHSKYKPVCTSLSSLLFILLFIKSHILFLHILLVFAHLVLHFSLYSLFLFFTYIYALVWCYFLYNFYSLHCPLSGPDSIYISLLIIPCIIYHVTNKETLNLEPWIKILW